MAARVAGVWVLGWGYAPITELELWTNMLGDFGIETITMSPVSGIRSRLLNEKEEMVDVLAEARSAGMTIVFVDERGESVLSDFEHPEEALYVFGKVSQSQLGLLQPGDLSVRIVPDRGGMWPHQAAAIALYDRGQKGL